MTTWSLRSTRRRAPWQYDTFMAHWRERGIEDAFVTFALKPDGSIDHFTMQAVSFGQAKGLEIVTLPICCPS